MVASFFKAEIAVTLAIRGRGGSAAVNAANRRDAVAEFRRCEDEIRERHDEGARRELD